MIPMKRQLPSALLFAALLLAGCAMHHDMSGHDMSGGKMADHSAHKAMMNNKNYERSVESYQIPDLTLTNHEGQRVSLAQLLQTDKPVIVNFIYATCTTICPLLSMGYIDLQRELGDKTDDILLISITIDPEHDSPEVLNSYRKKFNGKPGWTLLTGSRLDIEKATTAFNTFFADKMDHQPLNFIKLPEQDKWVRLTGMLSGSDFVHEMKMAGVR